MYNLVGMIAVNSKLKYIVLHQIKCQLFIPVVSNVQLFYLINNNYTLIPIYMNKSQMKQYYLIYINSLCWRKKGVSIYKIYWSQLEIWNYKLHNIALLENASKFLPYWPRYEMCILVACTLPWQLIREAVSKFICIGHHVSELAYGLRTV